MRHIDYYMDFITPKAGGGEPPSGTVEISITENGRTEHNVSGYATAGVTVAVPGPTGTKEISIVQNGTTTEDVAAYESAQISVQVPGPTGTKEISIAQNGSTTEDVADFAEAHIVVAVPEPSGTKSVEITSNGDTSYDVKDFAQVDVSVQVPGPTGEKAISIVQNGQTVEDVADFATAKITVAVPEPTGTIDITQNGLVDVKNYAQANVNVSGGGGEAYEQLVKCMSEAYNGYNVENSDITRLRSYAFYNNDKLISVSLPECTYSGNDAFYGSAVRSVSMPKLQRIGTNMFRNTSLLKSVELPAVTIIDEYAFYGSKVAIVKCDACTSIFERSFQTSAIVTIDILGGGTLEAISPSAISTLEAFVIRGDTLTTLDAIDFFPPTCKIYVNDKIVDEYKAATNWSKLAEQIFPLSEYAG